MEGMFDPTPSSSDASSPTGAISFDRFFDRSLDLLCFAGLDDGYFKRVNPSWTRVLGWSEAELLTRPVHEFMHPDDRPLTLQARAALAQGTPVRGLENRYLCKDGSYRWLSWQSIAEPGRPIVFAIARDVTERRQLEYEQLVVGKLESTGLLAGGMAHDYNNLLTALRLNLDLVELSGPVTMQQQQILRQAKGVVDTAAALTQQLLAIADEDVTGMRQLDLGALLHRATEAALRDSTTRLRCEIAPDLGAIRGNEAQLSQVFRGLVLNAREASTAGGEIVVTAENCLPGTPLPAGLRPGGYVLIRITDNGSGIAPDVLPKIFDPYFSTKMRGPQKGMGLGLTFCRVILSRHGGAIRIDSTPGRGTTVSCFLPVSGAGMADSKG